jgi:dihydrolipoamide dehydrogenase
MDQRMDVAIVGAGSAGLAAAREVRKVTDRFVVIQGGPPGTTCARVGCMPSKVLIQIADDFHRRSIFAGEGISSGEQFRVDTKAALGHVRALRDRFVGGMLTSTKELGEHYLPGHARFVAPNVLLVDDKISIRADAVIVATGSDPVIPENWLGFRDRLVTSDDLFEMEDLPRSMAVIGLGSIGLEMGQALGRLGVSLAGFERSLFLGGLSDPKVNAYAMKTLARELDLTLGHETDVEPQANTLRVWAGEKQVIVDSVFVALGRRPNLDSLDFHNSGATVKDGRPTFNPKTMQIEGLPLFFAGDVDGYRPFLHEAIDEGYIAGHNAVRLGRAGLSEMACFRRRTPLGIAFSDPNIAFAGERWASLSDKKVCAGEVEFDTQGRSLIMQRNAGCLRIYGDPESGRLLGAELIAPAGEHLAHLLAWAIQKEMTVHDALQMPFYHPVVEEGVRTALRDLAAKMEPGSVAGDLPYCDPRGLEVIS